MSEAPSMLVPIPSAARGALSKLILGSTSARRATIGTRGSLTMDQPGISRALPRRPLQPFLKREVCQRAKIAPTVGPACARHTFATRCAEGGLPLPFLQKILGHSTPTITARYYVSPVAPVDRRCAEGGCVMNLILTIAISMVAVVVVYGGVFWLLIAGYRRLAMPPNTERQRAQYSGFMEFLRRVRVSIAPGASPFQKP